MVGMTVLFEGWRWVIVAYTKSSLGDWVVLRHGRREKSVLVKDVVAANVAR